MSMNASRGLPRAQSRGFTSLGLILLLVIGLVAFAGAGWWAVSSMPATLTQVTGETILETGSSADSDTTNQCYKRVAESIIVADGQGAIQGVDTASFTEVGTFDNCLGKDKTHVYFNRYIIEGADPATIRVVWADGTSTPFLLDKRKVYSAYYRNYSPLDGADPASFKVLIEKVPGFYWLFYGVDRLHVYSSWGSLIDKADPSTFTFVKDVRGQDSGFEKDESHVWAGGLLVPQADPTTFVALAPFSTDVDIAYAKDIRHAYRIYPPRDEGTGDFEVHMIVGADLATFTYVGNNYAKDKNRVYSYYLPPNDRVVGADPATFTAVQDPSGKIDSRDAAHTYLGGERVQ